METDSTEQTHRARLRRLIIIVASIGIALLVAILIVLALLLARGTGQPVAAPTSEPTSLPTPSATSAPPTSPVPSPSATQPATPSPEAPATPPSPYIYSFTSSVEQVDCRNGGSVPVIFSWSTVGPRVDFGIGTDLAETAPFRQFQRPEDAVQVDYQCGQPDGTQKYSIAVIGDFGVVARQTIALIEVQ